MHMQAFQESGFCKSSEINRLKEDKLRLKQQMDGLHTKIKDIKASGPP